MDGKEENTEAKVQRYIHNIQLPLIKSRKQKDGFTYKLGFNKFHNNKKLQPVENSGFQNHILVKSVPVDSKKATSCEFCYGVKFSAPHES